MKTLHTTNSPFDLATMPPTVYVCGPMSGRKNHNFPAFHAATEKLRQMGFIVINPAEGKWNKSRDRTWQYYMAHDIAKMVFCDWLYCLPGWRKSRGARLEVHIAKRLKKQIYSYPDRARIA